MEYVVIINFSSVLEIIFGVNFLFVYFELRPEFAKRWEDMGKRYKITKKAVIKAHPDDPQKEFDKLFKMQFRYIVLEAIMTYQAAIMSVISLGLLLTSGFDPNFKVMKWAMVGYLIIALSLPVLYFKTHAILYGKAREGFIQAAEKYGTGDHFGDYP